MIKAIVTDIEGTTTKLSFVKDLLFPYAHQHLAEYVENNQQKSEVKAVLEEAKQLLQDHTLSIEELIQLFLLWIEQDKKITPLKKLQGFIWQEGYQSGKLKSHVYADAAEQLIQWRQQGLTLAIFSSGSILAQKLLFTHTEQGDLTSLFTGFFDTTTGPKNVAESYKKIAQDINVPLQHILFLSDIAVELDAAAQAGMRVLGLAREDNMPISHHAFVKDFTAIDLENYK